MARPLTCPGLRGTWAARYAAGATQREIAEADGCHRYTVARHLAAIGHARRLGGSRGRRPQSAWHEVAVAMRAEGATLAEIARHVGRTRQGVAVALACRARDAPP